MTTTQLSVECELQFAWTPGLATVAQRQGNLLLLRVVNQLETAPRETETEHSQERLEGKLDLLLHWLGTLLFAEASVLAPSFLRLDARGVEWRVAECSQVTVGQGIVSLALHPALAAPLKLAAVAGPVQSGWWRAEFEPMAEELAEQWTQWLFRQHRRAIQNERREQGPPSPGGAKPAR